MSKSCDDNYQNHDVIQPMFGQDYNTVTVKYVWHFESTTLNAIMSKPCDDNCQIMMLFSLCLDKIIYCHS